MHGEILGKFGEQGWEHGMLGYPLNNTTCGLIDNGCYQHFERGSIYRSDTSHGLHFTRGRIRDTWEANGWELGRFGYPITDEICGDPNQLDPTKWMHHGGCYQHFSRENTSVYWTPFTNAHFIRGLIKDTWGRYGYETGKLAYPMTDEDCTLKDNGCFQKFATEEGSTHPRSIYWSPRSGAHPVLYRHVLAKWANSGWEQGTYGYPDQDPSVGQTGALVQHFQGGWIQN